MNDVKDISNDYMIKTLLHLGLIKHSEISKAYYHLLPRLKTLEEKGGLYGLTVVNKHLTYMRSQMERYEAVHRLEYMIVATDKYIQRYKIQKGEYEL